MLMKNFIVIGAIAGFAPSLLAGVAQADIGAEAHTHLVGNLLHPIDLLHIVLALIAIGLLTFALGFTARPVWARHAMRAGGAVTATIGVLALVATV